MATPQTQQNPAHIQEKSDGDRTFVLHPEDNDVFVRTGKQIIAACSLGISIDLWLSEFSGMVEQVQRWITERAPRIRACFCAPGGTRTVLFFVPTSVTFDFDLADELSALTSKLVSEFNVGMVELRQIPWEELDRFLDLDSAKQIYGEQRQSHPPVEA